MSASAMLHNPTGYSLSAASAHEVLQMAQRHGFYVVEDDTYCHIAPDHAPRVTALDRFAAQHLYQRFCQGAGVQLAHRLSGSSARAGGAAARYQAAVTSPPHADGAGHGLVHGARPAARHAERCAALAQPQLCQRQRCCTTPRATASVRPAPMRCCRWRSATAF
ncbi:hypothetical protein ACNQTB_12330, partial [Corynebacterium diphtheriae]